MTGQRLLSGHFLQAEIILAVLLKIRCLRLRRDPLGGIVPEFSAFSVQIHNTFFDTQCVIIIQPCAELAVAAAFFDFLTEKHNVVPLSCFF